MVEKVGALLGCVVDPDAPDGTRIVAGPGEGLEQTGGKAGAAGQSSSAIRRRPARLVTGMMPARIGALMPARMQRSRKSKKSLLSKKSWVQM